MEQTHLQPGRSGWLRMIAAAIALVAGLAPQLSHAEPAAPKLRNIVLVHGGRLPCTRNWSSKPLRIVWR